MGSVLAGPYQCYGHHSTLAGDSMPSAHWSGMTLFDSDGRVVVEGKVNRDAAWFFPAPRAAAAQFLGRVASWRGLRVG